MPRDVSCDVCNCLYNCKEKCQADTINVNNCSCNRAHNSKETQCRTFKCK